MRKTFSRTLRLAGTLAAVGLLVATTGCRKNSASAAQSPPPPSLSSPVRPEQAASKPAAAPAAVVVPVDNLALKTQPAPVSKPLPTVKAPAPAAPEPQVAQLAQATAPPQPEAAPAKPDYYVMQRGDTLYGIARKFNIPPKDLIAANNFRDPNRLPVGTRVKLP